MRTPRSIPKIPLFLCVLLVLVVGYAYRVYRGPVTDVSQSEPVNTVFGTIAPDAVPAIHDPAFESVASADQYLNNDGMGIAVSLNGISKFYPYQLLVWHHLVNDTFGGDAVLISFHPFAMSGAAYVREVNGAPVAFGLSNKLANSGLLLYDRATRSFWDPMTHTAVEGEKTGTVLARVPSAVMTWTAYKALYPSGSVLSRKTGFARDYTHDPYGNYRFGPDILFPVTFKDDRLAAKERIYGIEWKQTQKAYPFTLIEKQERIEDVLASESVTIEYDAKTGIVRAFTSGATRREIPVTPSFWFTWAAAFPGTEVFKK